MKYVFVALVFLAVCVSMVNGKKSGLKVVRYFLVISCILPVCLRINLDLSKMYFSFMV